MNIPSDKGALRVAKLLPVALVIVVTVFATYLLFGGSDTPRIDLTALRRAQSIDVVHGRPDRTVFVLAGPDCPHCKRQHKELEKLTNLRIVTIVLPAHSPAVQTTANSAWCSLDRAAAWSLVMNDQAVAPSQSCDTSAFRRNWSLAKAMNVRETPFLVTGDGRYHGGFLGADKLEELLTKQ